MDETKEIIKEYYSKLPPEMKKAIAESNWAEKIQEISKKHNLHIDQAGGLENETICVLLGILPSAEFVENVTKSLEIETSKATEIAKDVNTEIFLKIRESMKKVYPGASREGEEEVVEREEILRGIEDEGEKSIGISMGIEKNKLEDTRTSTDTGVPAMGIVEQKLTSSVKIPQQEKSFTPAQDVVKKTYAVDPYREPTA